MASHYFLKQKLVFIYVLQGHPGNVNVAKFMPEIVSHRTAAVPHGFTTLDAFGGAVLPVCSPWRVCSQSGLTYGEHPPGWWLQWVVVVPPPGW